MAAEQWTIEDGLNLIRAIQPEARRFGYHIALGGGVLNNGISYKDIDLYFLPLENPAINGGKAEPKALAVWLTEMWGHPRVINDYAGDEVLNPIDEEEAPAKESIFGSGVKRVRKSTTYRHKMKFFRGDDHTRIDVFILGQDPASSANGWGVTTGYYGPSNLFGIK